MKWCRLFGHSGKVVSGTDVSNGKDRSVKTTLMKCKWCDNIVVINVEMIK